MEDDQSNIMKCPELRTLRSPRPGHRSSLSTPILPRFSSPPLIGALSEKGDSERKVSGLQQLASSPQNSSKACSVRRDNDLHGSSEEAATLKHGSAERSNRQQQMDSNLPRGHEASKPTPSGSTNAVAEWETLHLPNHLLPARRPQHNENHPHNTITASGSPRQLPQLRPKVSKTGRKQGNDMANQDTSQRVPSSQTLHEQVSQELDSCQNSAAGNSSASPLQDCRGSYHPPLKTPEMPKNQAIWAHPDPGAVGRFSPNAQMAPVIPDQRGMSSEERIERAKEIVVRRYMLEFGALTPMGQYIIRRQALQDLTQVRKRYQRRSFVTIALGPQPDAELWIFAQDMMDHFWVEHLGKRVALARTPNVDLVVQDGLW